MGTMTSRNSETHAWVAMEQKANHFRFQPPQDVRNHGAQQRRPGCADVALHNREEEDHHLARPPERSGASSADKRCRRRGPTPVLPQLMGLVHCCRLTPVLQWSLKVLLLQVLCCGKGLRG